MRTREENMSASIIFFMLVVSCQGQRGILNNSVLWVARDGHLHFSTRLQEWTEAKITPQEFGKSIKSVVIKDASSIHGIAGDIPTRHLVTSDTDNNWIALFGLDVNEITYFHIGISKDIGHLAIDWLGRNVYWTDAGFGWIAMKHLPENITQVNLADQNFRVVVDEFIEKPTGIVVHPERYFLFWTDTGQTPKIERSNLIGQERKTIIWQSIVKPTTLCIDQSADRLYWSDPARRTIEYSDFEGKGRRILMSDPELNYYGIAVFRDLLIYTVPNFNRTGYVSLKENIEGEHVQASIEIQNIKPFDVMAYASEIQEEPTDALCKKVNECDQICLHMEMDAGFTCLCSDGYDLISDRYCTVDEKVLERHILFTNDKSICAVPISVLSLGSSTIFSIHCNLVKRDNYVTRFAINMRTKMIFYTNGSTIFKQPAFKDDQREVLNKSSGIIIDMDFDWISRLLYWIVKDNGHLYYVHESGLEVFDEQLTDSDITNIAVDPHNKKVYWISSVLKGTENKYVLNAWSMKTKRTVILQTSLLSKPSDLDYDRLKDRLLWNDNDGHIGIINTDGTGERKYDTATTGEPRHAVTVYKNFIISSTEENRQFDIVYELDEQRFSVNLHKAYDGFVEDVHVYESALQPFDLESCEINYGDCEHVCLPENKGKCDCLLGYFLNDDNKSCRSAVLNENYFVVLDAVQKGLYQVDNETKAIHTITIRQDNVPVGLAFDPKRKGVIWVDKKSNSVKKITLGSSDEKAVMSGVDNNADIAVDVSSGNIYISSGRNISVVRPSFYLLTIVDSTNIIANIGKIAVMPQSGSIAWYEGNTRIVIANMDGSNVRPITVQSMKKPEDIAFDLDDDRGLYWCDSVLDKIEKIDTQSLAITIVYERRGLKPVAIEIFADVIYLIPMQQRKIVQINKINGLQQRDVFESPLIGSLDNFFISRKSVTGHDLCGDCNGGCSNLCLPIGRSKRCACREGVNLKQDELTCQYAVDICPKKSYTGLNTLEDCCPNEPGAQCRPTCQSGYEKASTTLTTVQCKNGKWNVNLDSVCKEEDGKQSYVIYIIIGVGVVVLLVIVGVAAVFLCRRRNQRKQNGTGQSNVQGNPYTYETYGRNGGYATADGILSPDPPPSEDRIPQLEVYHNLNEAEMIGADKVNVVEYDNNMQEERRGSSVSGRYSKWPSENDGYLTAIYTKRVSHEPQPDYPDSDHNNGYLVLQPSSIDSGSRLRSINSSFANDRDQQDSGTYHYRNSRNSPDQRVFFNRDPLSAKYSLNVK